MPRPRPLIPADVDAYVALRREMLLDTPHAFAASPGADRGSDAEHLRAALAGDGYAILGVFDNTRRLVATAGINRQTSPKNRHLAWIWGVYVTPAARGRGLGRAVVEAAIQTARAWPGVAGLRLAVSAETPIAQRVYESLGFQAYGLEPDAIRIEGRSFAEVHMYLTL